MENVSSLLTAQEDIDLQSKAKQKLEQELKESTNKGFAEPVIKKEFKNQMHLQQIFVRIIRLVEDVLTTSMRKQGKNYQEKMGLSVMM